MTNLWQYVQKPYSVLQPVVSNDAVSIRGKKEKKLPCSMLLMPRANIQSASTERLQEIQEEHKFRDLVEPLQSFWDNASWDWKHLVLAGMQSDIRHEEVKLLPALSLIQTICLFFFFSTWHVQHPPNRCCAMWKGKTEWHWWWMTAKAGGSAGSKCCCCCQEQLSRRRRVDGKVHLVRKEYLNHHMLNVQHSKRERPTSFSHFKSWKSFFFCLDQPHWQTW